ncbi:interferon regulatory factor 9-like [Hyperolius riggenbachi]|uniref:interferon regulatory factor 9 n=1 Tax=Hyperolius riggenbachi TaxID=752182 RepID=UPI0035A27A0B
MANGRARNTRKLKDWLIEQIESGKYPGLEWDDDQKTCFRIPWKHAGKQDFRHDEDAAIFKAWAQYKNKYKTGDKIEAAAWKTRFRCALNKSPEFQEQPGRSQLDISEPYKVYRLVPPEEQEVPSSTKLSKKRKSTAEAKGSSSDEADLIEKKPLVKLELSSDASLEAPRCASADSGNGSDSSNTDALCVNPLQASPHINTLISADFLEMPVQQITHTVSDMKITVMYSGVEILQTLVHSGECKLSAKGPTQNSAGSMEHVLLPPPREPLGTDICNKTKNLLSFLQAGVMLASNTHGIFAQRQKMCSGRIFWTGPCANNQGIINKLERDEHVKLFDLQKFLRELEIYKTHGGTPPDSHVTLCFGEEILDRDPTEDKLITAKIEQVVASELVQQATEYCVPEENPCLITLTPVDTSDVF